MIVVTGASGFVGRRVVAELAADGVPTRGVVRSPGTAQPAGVQRVAISGLDDTRGLLGACDGVDTVIHLAARVHVMRDSAPDPLAAFRKVNVEGTRNVVESAIAQGARRIIFVSSVKAAAERSGAEPLRDTDVPAPADAYGRSKLEAEQVVLRCCTAAGVDGVVLRPPLIYGPGMRANMLRLFGLVRRGLPLPLASVENRRSVLFVGNLSAAIRALVRRQEAAGGTYYVADKASLSTPRLVQLIAAAMDRPCRLVPVPPRLLEGMGRAVEGTAAVFNRSGARAAAVVRLTQSLHVDTTALRERLGFEPPFSTEMGLQETVAWYLSRHSR